MSDPTDRSARRAKALGILAGAAVAAAGVAITLVGGILGRRRSG